MGTTTAGSSAARHAATLERNDAARWAVGALAEQRTANMFAPLERRFFPPASVLHDRAPVSGRFNIDHMVVARSGVWIIDTKHWKGGFGVRNGELAIGARTLTTSLEYLRRARTQAADVCAAAGFSWVPIHIAFALDCQPQRPQRYGDVVVANTSKLARVLTCAGPVRARERDTVAAALDAAFVPYE